jgi:hypothetical protein
VSTFVAHYRGRRPVVFTRPESQDASLIAFQAVTTEASLRARYPHLAVTLASSNSFSYQKRQATLEDYLDNHMAPQPPDALANESWYLFGDTKLPGLLDSGSPYLQPLDAAESDGLPVFGLGGHGSGVSFHTHGPAIGEAVHGAKRWFLYPPGPAPPFQGDRSQLQWVVETRPHLLSAGSVAASPRDAPARAGPVLECTLQPGELIYVPAHWWHATLNLGPYCAFVSVFTREDLGPPNVAEPAPSNSSVAASVPATPAVVDAPQGGDASVGGVTSHPRGDEGGSWTRGNDERGDGALATGSCTPTPSSWRGADASAENPGDGGNKARQRDDGGR